MELNKDNYCKIHNLHYFVCSFEKCEKRQVCKFCSLEIKEEVQHLYEHYDYIKFQSEKENFNKYKEDDFFIEINKVYAEVKKNLDNRLENIFNDILLKKEIISQHTSEYLDSNYCDLTTSFEDLAKNLSEKLNNLNLQDRKAKEDVRKMKSDLDAKLELLSNPEPLVKELNLYCENLELKLKKLTVKDVLENKFNFSFKRNNCKLEWESGSPILNVVPKGSSYWSARSEEIVEGEFICKIAIRHINNSNVNGYWNYTMGLCKLQVQSDSTYYNDCVLFQSNGYCPTQYSGSGSGKKIIDKLWANGDVLILKRDGHGSVFFGINDEEKMVLGFENIIGPMKVVMGFSTSMNNNEIFEIIEFKKF
jgi:hypothetical protein